MLKTRHNGLLLDPGLGKTSVSLAAISIRLQKRHIKRALVVAPLKAAYEVWPEQISSWADFNHLGIAMLHDTGKDKTLRSLTREQQVCLINPEGFEWLVGDSERIKQLGAQMLVIDESSKWKHTNTVRFKALKRVLHLFDYRSILTGSPRPRNYLDLFGQVYIMDQGAALGRYITHYRNQYFFPTGFQMREWELLPGKDKEINARVAPLVLRQDASDHLKLPGTPDRIHKITLPPAVRKEYDSLEENLMSTLFSAPLTTSAAARSKCAQLANGAVYTDRNLEDDERARPWKIIHGAKVDALEELYDELQGEPLLLAIGFHHDVDHIRKRLGAQHPCINSKAGKSYTSDAISDWNKGLLPLLMVHPASAGHGLNLQAFSCRHVGFFHIPDDYDHYDQTFRRVWRQGNKAKYVMRHNFVTTATVDVAKMRNLHNKGNGQRAFLDAMRWYAEQRTEEKNDQSKAATRRRA